MIRFINAKNIYKLVTPAQERELKIVCVCHFADVIVGMGFSKDKINESLSKMNYDEITAIYLLLARKTNEVNR